MLIIIFQRERVLRSGYEVEIGDCLIGQGNRQVPGTNAFSWKFSEFAVSRRRKESGTARSASLY